MRVLLDTNVLFDITARRKPFFEQAKLLLAAQIFGDLELWVSAKSYTDIFFVMNRDFDSALIQQSFLRGLEYFKVCSVDESTVHEAATRAWPDFEDALVAVCAENVRADYLVTRDASGFTRSSIPAISPNDLFERLENELGVSYAEVAG